MRSTRIAALTFALASLAACQQGGNQPAFTSADSLAVDSVRLAWQTAYNAGDAAAVAALYDSMAVNMPGDAPSQTGREAIRAGIAAQLAAMPHAPIEIGAAAHFNGFGTTAIVVGPFHVTTGDSAHPTRLDGKYLVVVKRGQDGKWRLRYDASSFDAPMPASPPPPPARH